MAERTAKSIVQFDITDLPEIENPLFNLEKIEAIYHSRPDPKGWAWREAYRLVCYEMVRRMSEHHPDWRHSEDSYNWYSWTSAMSRASHDLPNLMTFLPSDTADDARQARESYRQNYAEEAKRVRDEIAPRLTQMNNDELIAFIIAYDE